MRCSSMKWTDCGCCLFQWKTLPEFTFIKSYFIRNEHGYKGNLDNIAPLNLAREDFILAAAGCTALSEDGPLDGGCKEEEGTGVDEEELLLGAEEDGRGSADAATDRAASLSSTEIRESAPAVN